MCLPGGGTHITGDSDLHSLAFFPVRGTDIISDICFPGGVTPSHITRNIVSHVGEHISQGICVSLAGEEISLVLFVSRVGEHISLRICVSKVREHISLGICVSQVRGTHITRDMCFPGVGTHH